MKKILAIMMSLLMICGLAACGEQSDSGELTPYEIVEQASQKLADVDGVAYGLEMTMTMSDPDDAENSFEMAMNGDIEMEKVAENNYKLAYHVATDMSAFAVEDTTINMDMYYTDGYMYYDMSGMGIQYKVPMDMTEAMEAVNSPDFSDIEEGMVKEQTIKADGTGQIVNMILDGTKMTDMVKAMSEEFAAMGEDDALSIGDIPYTVYLDSEGNITNIDMVMNFAMDVEGMTMNMSMDTKMTVEQVGGVTVALPDGLEDFTEISLDMDDQAA